MRVLKEEFLSGRKKESGEENAPGGEGGLRRESICDPLLYRPDSDKIQKEGPQKGGVLIGRKKDGSRRDHPPLQRTAGTDQRVEEEEP